MSGGRAGVSKNPMPERGKSLEEEDHLIRREKKVKKK